MKRPALVELLPPESTRCPSGLAQADRPAGGAPPTAPLPHAQGDPVPAAPRPSLQSPYLFLLLNTKRFSTGPTQQGLPAGRETHPFTHSCAPPAAAPRGTPAHQGGSRAQPWPCQAPKKGAEATPQARPRTAQVAQGAQRGGCGVRQGPTPKSRQKTASWTGGGAERPCYSPLGATAGRGGAGGRRRALSSCTGRARPRSR